MEQRAPKGDTPRGPFRDSRIWRLAIVYFTIPVALYTIGFWLPQIIKATSNGSDLEVGLLSAIPYLIGATGMIAAGRHSDRTGERRAHVVIGGLVGGVMLAASAAAH